MQMKAFCPTCNQPVFGISGNVPANIVPLHPHSSQYGIVVSCVVEGYCTVEQVRCGMTAHAEGVRVGDCIMSINEERCTTLDGFTKVLRKCKEKKCIAFLDRKITLSVSLSALKGCVFKRSAGGICVIKCPEASELHTGDVILERTRTSCCQRLYKLLAQQSHTVTVCRNSETT